MRIVGRCEVTIPKFRFSTSYSLVKYLKDMGMHDAFNFEKADFSGIAKPIGQEKKLFLSNAIHKTFLKVNKTGTEAVAATSFDVDVEWCFTPYSPPDEVFKADHPFAFFIRDQSSGLVIFMGRVMHPLSK